MKTPARTVLIAAVGFLALGAGAACGPRRLQARARQPNPYRVPAASMESTPLHIDLKDMETPKYVLRNTAYFKVVSRDRLRFHVTLVHKWQEMTDVRGWSAVLVDDHGRRHHAQSKEKRYTRHLTRMWDVDRRSAVKNEYGDIVHVRDDGYRRRTPLESVDLFRGEGDFVFYARDLFHRDVKRLTLVMNRGGTELRYVWEFAEDGGTEVDHHRARPSGAPAEIHPGPLTGGR